MWDQAGLQETKTISVAVAAAPSGPVLTLPPALAVTPGSTTTVSGVSVADAFAASSKGSMVLQVDAGSGTVTMTNSNGAKVAGSGTHDISFTGTYAQISYDLAHLSYTANSTAGSDSISVKVLDQAGLEIGQIDRRVGQCSNQRHHRLGRR